MSAPRTPRMPRINLGISSLRTSSLRTTFGRAPLFRAHALSLWLSASAVALFPSRPQKPGTPVAPHVFQPCLRLESLRASRPMPPLHSVTSGIGCPALLGRVVPPFHSGSTLPRPDCPAAKGERLEETQAVSTPTRRAISGGD